MTVAKDNDMYVSAYSKICKDSIQYILHILKVFFTVAWNKLSENLSIFFWIYSQKKKKKKRKKEKNADLFKP